MKELNLPYKFFYGRGSHREPLADEVFLNCGDKYIHNSEKMKAICEYALDDDYGYLLRLDDDTFIYPDKLLRLDWRQDYAGAAKGDFHPGGCLFLSRRAMELIRNSQITNWADDAWIGSVMRDHHIPMHGLPEIHNEFGIDYSVVPKKLPVGTLASFHSCRPEVMEELWTLRTMSSSEPQKGTAGKH